MIQLPLPRNTCLWQIGLADSFRNRSRKLFSTYGTNLQNPSERICRIYEADPGKLLVQADQAGAEALIVAYLAKHGNYRKLFLNNLKPHSYVAMQIFKYNWLKEGHTIVGAACACDIDALKFLPGFNEFYKEIKFSKDGKRYYLGKKTAHAYSYGQGSRTFRKNVLKESEGQIALSAKEAKLFLTTFESVFPEIKEWQIETIERVRKDKEIRNLFGFPRKLYTPLDKSNERQFLAYVPQSTVGVLTNLAIAEIYRFCKKEKLNWDILNNKHDSVLMQAPENEAVDCGKEISKIMSKELITPRGEKFRMKVEVGIGKNWGKYSLDKNPEGMKETI